MYGGFCPRAVHMKFVMDRVDRVKLAKISSQHFSFLFEITNIMMHVSSLLRCAIPIVSLLMQ
jgi:hypothetical protein